jgi:hypothetical protein
MCLVDVMNGELCYLVEYVHECLCALVNLVILNGDVYFGEMMKCELYVCDWAISLVTIIFSFVP